MKIVIAGAHEVGTHLARLLSQESKEVVLMDADQERVSQLTYLNLLTMVGSPTSVSALKEVGVPKCDLFIAVTPNESVNIHACILAANMGARRTMARVDSYETQNEEIQDFYRRLGINRLIYPELLGGQAIAAAIRTPWARQCIRLCDGLLCLVGVKVREGAHIVGQSLQEIGTRMHEHFHVAAIKRDTELLIPGGRDVIQAGDLVYFVTLPQKIDIVRSTCDKRQRELQRVVFTCGLRMSIQAAYRLKDDYELVFIEQDAHQAEYIMQRFSKARVIRGTANDTELLKELDFNRHDAFVAVGPDSGANILACLTAKKMGVGKTVVEVGDIEQISTAQAVDIGSTVNKKLITAAAFYQVLLDEDKTNAKCFGLDDAQVADLEAKPGAAITKAPVMEVMKSPFLRGIGLGGMVRNGVPSIVTGQTQIQAGDRVVVICRNTQIESVERLFVK